MHLQNLYVPHEGESTYLAIKSKSPIKKLKTPFNLEDIFGPFILKWEDYYGPSSDEAFFRNIDREQSTCYVIWPEGEFAAHIDLRSIQNFDGNILVEVSEHENMWSKVKKEYKKKPEQEVEVTQVADETNILHKIAQIYMNEVKEKVTFKIGDRVQVSDSDKKYNGRSGTISSRIRNTQSYRVKLDKTREYPEASLVFQASKLTKI